MNTWIWIFLIAMFSLGSAQFTIYETKQRELNLCEEQVLIEEAYNNAEAACKGQVAEFKEYQAGYAKLEISLNEWIKECKE